MHLNNLEGEGLCDNVDLGDVALNFSGVYDQMLNCIPQAQTRYSSEDGGLDCFVMEKNLSVTESNSHIENTIEVFFYFCHFSYVKRIIRREFVFWN